MYLVLCSTLFLLLNPVFSANILSVITTPSYSHQAPWQTLWRELSLKGHKVTVITTNPQNNASLTNLKEIDISYAYKIYKEFNVMEKYCSGNITAKESARLYTAAFNQTEEAVLNSPEVQNLLNNPSIHFDLVIMETQSPTMMGLSWKFKCPLIGICSFDPPMTYQDAVGNIVHPIINPEVVTYFSLKNENFAFLERLYNVFYMYMYKNFVYNKLFITKHADIKKYFGDDLPPLDEINKNISALFVTTHPFTHNIRPTNLNTFSVGGMLNIKNPEPLPEHLQKFLDEATEGVIYFCLGSNIKDSMVPPNFLETILQVFSKIPYKVLMRLDAEIENLPKNVKIEKWIPQQDVMRHPNVKLFVSHGGLNSIIEAIYNAIPILVIPLCGDAFASSRKIIDQGNAIKLDLENLNTDTFTTAIKEVIENPKYRQRAQEMSEIYKDEEIPSLDRAIYWIEYVIKYKGAKHLRSHVVDIPFWKFYMLDILAILISVSLILLLLSYVILKLLIKLVLRIFRKPQKTHKD